MKSFGKFLAEGDIEWSVEGGTYTYDDGKRAVVIGWTPPSKNHYENPDGDGIWVGWNDERGQYKKKYFGTDLIRAKKFIQDQGYPSPPANVNISAIKNISR